MNVLKNPGKLRLRINVAASRASIGVGDWPTINQRCSAESNAGLLACEARLLRGANEERSAVGCFPGADFDCFAARCYQ